MNHNSVLIVSHFRPLQPVYTKASTLASQQLMQQQVALMAAAQGTYAVASPVNVLGTQMQGLSGLAAHNGIATAAITPTTATLASGRSSFHAPAGIDDLTLTCNVGVHGCLVSCCTVMCCVGSRADFSCCFGDGSATHFTLIQPHWLTGHKTPIYLLTATHFQIGD